MGLGLYSSLVFACWERKRRDREVMLSEQRMLVCSDMLGLKKDIGDHNPVALRRHYGILVGWAQSDKLVVGRNQVTSRDLVLII